MSADGVSAHSVYVVDMHDLEDAGAKAVPSERWTRELGSR